MKKLITVLGLTLATHTAAVHAAALRVYWSDTNNQAIYRQNVDGTGLQTLQSGAIAQFATGIAVDSAAGHLYWLDSDSPDEINRSNLDGSGTVNVLDNSPVIFDGPADMEVDALNGHLYWTDTNLGQIKRSNLDGSGVTTLLTGQTSAYALALDPVGGKLYFSRVSGSNGQILSANLDGTGLSGVLASDASGFIAGLDLDLTSNQFYYTNFGGQDIRRANLDGTGNAAVVENIGLVQGIALDTDANHLYVANLTADRVQRYNLDGTGAFNFTTNSFPVPRDVELEFETNDSLLAPSSLSLDLGTVIVGASAADTVDVSNSSVSFDGDFTATPTGDVSVSPTLGTVLASSSQSLTISMDTTTAGLKSGTVTLDNTSNNADADDVVTVTGSVLAHSEGSFDDGANLDSLTINFGTFNQFDAATPISVIIFNLENVPGFTADMILSLLSASGDVAALGLGLGGPSPVVAGGFLSIDATLSTALPGTFSAIFTLGTQDTALPGAAVGTSLLLTLVGEVIAIPEPASFTLMALGAALIGRRRS